MHNLYDIPKMEDALKKATEIVFEEIKDEFKFFLKQFKKDDLSKDELLSNNQIQFHLLDSFDSLNQVYSSPGFYVICSDYKMPGKNSSFIINGQYQAIYRGECSSVRRRLESHLFNEKYNKFYDQRKAAKQRSGDKFSEPYYGACIKIDPNISGINIDSEPYSSAKWAVVVLKMAKSSSQVRKQTEQAFDELFGKPSASRE